MASHLTRALLLMALCLLPASAGAQVKREADRPKVYCEPSRALALFGELRGRDFEATLAHANQLGDRYLRASAVLALAAKCLEEAEKQEQQERPKPPARSGRKQ